MASGHVNRKNKAEHMAAPHRYLRRDDSPCQFGAVHTWSLAADETCPLPRQLPGVYWTLDGHGCIDAI
jgi:hypothetical protein